jgi:hypothetical protein
VGHEEAFDKFRRNRPWQVMTDKVLKLYLMTMLQDLHIDREFAAESEEFEIDKVLEMNKGIGQVYTWTPTFIHSFIH